MSESVIKNLNERQQLFVFAYTDLTEGSPTYGNATKSAEKAGYSPRTAGQQGHALLKLPKIKEALAEHKEAQAEQLRQEFMKSAVQAHKALVSIVNDKDAPETARVSAAKDLLDRAGFKPVEKQEVKSETDGNITIVFGSED